MRKRYPKYFKALFEWFCKPALFEELQGDLEEEYNAKLESKGRRNAAWNYRKEVILMMRPSVIKSLAELSIAMPSGYMLGNYIKTALRTTRKNALFSGINIIGLSFSMAVGLFVISGIVYQFSFDQFHEHKEDTYRIITNTIDSYYGSRTYATSSLALVNDLLESEEGIDKIIRLNTEFGGAGVADSITLPLSGIYADQDFFDVFSFQLLEGNPATALINPFSIVLTKRQADRFFEGGSAIGKSIEFEGVGLFQITGVVEDPPANSHLQFASLASFSTIESLAEKEVAFTNLEEYSNLNYSYIYLKLDEGIHSSAIEQSLRSHALLVNSRFENISYSYSLQRITEIVPGKSLINQIGPEMEFLVLIIVSVLTGVIILSTCFNYTNLSLARALGRTKEIAIRKTMGGSKVQVFLQFIVEAIVISLLALIVALLISTSLKPYLYSFNVEIQNIFPFQITLEVALYFIIFSIIVGILAGFIPAVILSRQEILKLLKGSDQFRFLRFLNLRKSLIVFQFTLSLICIIVASVLMKQFQFSMNFDMGFDRDQILNVSLQGTDDQLFKDEFNKIPEVQNISMSSGYLGVGARSKYWIKDEEIQDSMIVDFLSIDENYLANHGIALIAGENFKPFDHESTDELVIVNEELLEEFNLGNPEDVLGAVLYSPGNKAFRIIGVSKNFHYDRLRNPIGGFFFTFQPEYFRYANLKIRSTDMSSTISKIRASWMNVNKLFEYEGEFYDDRVEEAYSFYKLAFGIIGFVTGFTILIACMGLLGIVIYTSKSRMKEVAIRKVLGAEERGLIYLLSKNFMGMMLWATGISVLFTFVLFQFLILPQEAYSASLGFWDFGVGVLIILSLGLITITSQTLRVARSNPVESIQNE